MYKAFQTEWPGGNELTQVGRFSCKSRRPGIIENPLYTSCKRA